MGEPFRGKIPRALTNAALRISTEELRVFIVRCLKRKQTSPALRPVYFTGEQKG